MSASSEPDTVKRLAMIARERRRRQRLTQAEVASRAHVSRTFVMDLETGHPRAELGKALAVFAVLGIHPFGDAAPIDDHVDGLAAGDNREGAARIAFADAALALAGHEITDPVLRSITDSAGRGEITAEEAIAAARRHVQG